MSRSVTITQPETVDQVCRRIYGDESGFVEAVLAANPGLGDAELIPIGTVVVLPRLAAVAEPTVPVVTLWS